MSRERFQHFSEDELLLRLYGAYEKNGAHLDACPKCRERWFALLDRREELVGELQAAVKHHDLLQQRRQILNRIEQPARAHGPLRSVWVPATVAALLVAGIIAEKVPEPKQASPKPSISKADEASELEARWFEDVYSVSQRLEPRAASPIRGLFAEDPVLE